MGWWNGGTVGSGPRARRRRVGIGGLAFALFALMLPAFADAPQTGTDPTVTLTVSPSTGLADGQVVTVTGTGFPAGTVGTISECGGTAAAPQCDPTTITPFVTTAAGTIPPTAFATKRIVNTGTTTFNCGVQACALVATAGSKSAQHQIRMAGAGTVPATSTTSSPTTSSTTTSIVPSTTTSSTTTTVPGTTTSTMPGATTSTVPGPTTTSSTAPTSSVPRSGCEELRRTQTEANASLDSLASAFPEYRGVAAQARDSMNATFAQRLAAAGC